MKNIINKIALFVGLAFFAVSCDFDFDLPESNSQVDTELPMASFSFQQDPVEWKFYQFANSSTESLFYEWDFGTGDTSTEENPSYVFEDGEGTYTVTLTSRDLNGETSTIAQDVVVEEPEALPAANPIIINYEFDKLPKSSGSDCSCSAWINTDIGEQGESSSGNGGNDNVVKFDNNEPDHVYQEFEITPNADFTMTLAIAFQSNQGGSLPSGLEIRVLAGSGYIDGYSPVYYEEGVEFPQNSWGYNTIEQVEIADNNLLVERLENPGDTNYNIYEFSFNSGANNSVALFIRGVGGEATGDYGYTGGDEEVRADYVIITADN